jgi:phytoene dehydrogenase-like protein
VFKALFGPLAFLMNQKNYDVVVIGAGMSGLAAGIRFAMFDKKVLIVEKHTIPGGLNSYYSRGKRQFDVGLHALTNFAAKSDKQKPLGKLLKQLRIPYEDLKLSEQTHSLIHFPQTQLKFSNDFNLLLHEIEKNFPREIDGFCRLVEKIKAFDEVNLQNKFQLAKPVVREFIQDPLLVEMIFCPLLIYGSSWENDMDFSQFVIMFKSIYFEGFSHPEGGVRTLLSILTTRFKELGGELAYKTEVVKIVPHQNEKVELQINQNEVISAKKVFSSMGIHETYRLIEQHEAKPQVGKLSFTESIFVVKEKPQTTSTIIFRNNSSTYHYEKAKNYFDLRSSVICFTDNFHPELQPEEYIVRVTNMANFELWNELLKESKERYKSMKEEVSLSALAQVKEVIPDFNPTILFKDIFSPTTIVRYTSHAGGAVYGSPDKVRDGKTEYPNIYIIGTDQGFLGIVGSMLSGISMANFHGLMNEF